MWQLPQQPLTIKQVVSQSYALFKDAFRKMHVLMTAFFVLLALPYVAMPTANFTWAEMMQSRSDLMVALLLVIYMLVVFWIYGAFYRQLNLIMRNQSVKTLESLLFVLKKLPILIVAFVVAIIANFLGYALLIIPGIYLIAVITLYYPLIIIDDLGPIAAGKKALHLVWGNWWRTALVLLVPIIVSTLLMLSVGLVAVLVSATFRLSAPVMDLLYVYIQVFLGTLFLPMSAVVNSVQIYNLKLRKSEVSSESMKSKLHIVNG